jgi:NAD dependent epimerase/dehydratase family enzyme
MADALLLSGANVKPTKLQSTAYKFMYPDLDSALRHVLGK